MLPIPKERLVEGARLCKDNAINLALSAEQTFEKYPTVASFLTILAFEEIGKGVCLLKSYKKGNDLTWKDWEKLTAETKAHVRKLRAVHTMLMDPYSLLKPHELSARLEEIKEFVHQTSDLAKKVHEFKLNYLYVGWDKRTNQWTTPVTGQKYDADEALERLRTAIRLLSKAIEHYA